MPRYQVYFDTRDGERKFDADISDDEILDDVLQGIISELTELGHMMRGLSTGELKVIWGGRDGRELDLGATLPDQGVRPNDVLRVLVEIYEGGGSRRDDRIDKEWELLARLATHNPGRVVIVDRALQGDQTIFRVQLPGSPGLVSAAGSRTQVSDTLTFRLAFPRFYPEMPVECYTEEPLFHPNINPESGFVCLWEHANVRDTVIQAVSRAQAMAAHRMVNLDGPHVMNARAAEWFSQFGTKLGLVPLTWDELRVFDVRGGRVAWLDPARNRRRTSAPGFL